MLNGSASSEAAKTFLFLRYFWSIVYGCRAPVVSNSVMSTAGSARGSDDEVIAPSNEGPIADDSARSLCWLSKCVCDGSATGTGTAGSDDGAPAVAVAAVSVGGRVVAEDLESCDVVACGLYGPVWTGGSDAAAGVAKLDGWAGDRWLISTVDEGGS